MAVDAAEEYMPPQYPKEFDSTDLRRLVGVAPKGYKVNPIKSQKRKRVEESDEPEPMEEETAMQQDEPQADAAQAGKRQKADDKTWRPVSGKVWKAPGQRASTVMKANVSGNKSWGRRMAEKAADKSLRETKAEALAAVKAKRKAAADQRKAARERKQANQAKSAVTQKITNAATVKKMMKDKKQRKLLRTADTN
ncbi:hypothetical protein HYH02_003984 [Chlamydomonas schloesseri]|uniref:Coiled-coil domain-containing protein 86 n=1 Tax=Chlamydomonas schloesseri TaxID=2026947 RepID=A0A835WQ17_9CHLO|nr:hypothetical protein HYH02_003984 [Chlamydomonas schloesseri]|eukprot:KAG2451382.1 hypothetical protein HYH02_003984 [Chlamydomonas schloesseri]